MSAARWSKVSLMLLVALGGLAAAAPPPASHGKVAGQDITSIEDLTLDDLLKVETTVATRKSKSSLESAAVLTVITRDEIQSSGARDLLEILSLVPGFSFASDVQGVVGPAFRGLWGYEGKILFMIDGLQVNELLYSTVQLGNHYPLDAVERIEIIRGPGSAIYGGNGELAVINVVTQTAAQINGATATLRYGQTARDFTSRTASVSVGTQDLGAPGLGLSLSAVAGEGNRSDREYTDFAGTTFASNGAQRLDPLLVNGAVTYKDLSVRVLFDNYRTTTRDGLDLALERPTFQRFRTLSGVAQYAWHVTDTLTLTPRLQVLAQEPWRVDDVESPIYYRKSATRALAGLLASWNARSDLDFLVGVEAHQDDARVESMTLAGLQSLFANDSASVSYSNLATYAQVLWDTPWVNVSAGARYELNSAYGSSFVPRLGLTKVVDRFHAKVLYSEAFRAPSIENIRITADILPERTHALEAELGYQLGDHVYAGLNAFDVTIDKPIVYFYDGATDSEAYLNGVRTGSRGVEAELKLKFSRGWANLSYSFAANAGKGAPDTYLAEGHPDQLVGMPMHKATLLASYQPVPGLSLAPSAVFLGTRYGYLSADADGNPVLGTEPASLMLNFFVSYQLSAVKGLQLGLGVFNLLDQNVRFLQPYNGGRPPLPGGSREVLARVTYHFGLD